MTNAGFANVILKLNFVILIEQVISTENLFQSSRQKDCEGEILAEICKKTGLEVL